MKNRKPAIILILLALTIMGYTRLEGIENIRTIQFLYIFATGALSALLIREVVKKYKGEIKPGPARFVDRN